MEKETQWLWSEKDLGVVFSITSHWLCVLDCFLNVYKPQFPTCKMGLRRVQSHSTILRVTWENSGRCWAQNLEQSEWQPLQLFLLWLMLRTQGTQLKSLRGWSQSPKAPALLAVLQFKLWHFQFRSFSESKCHEQVFRRSWILKISPSSRTQGSPDPTISSVSCWHTLDPGNGTAIVILMAQITPYQLMVLLQVNWRMGNEFKVLGPTES